MIEDKTVGAGVLGEGEVAMERQDCRTTVRLGDQVWLAGPARKPGLARRKEVLWVDLHMRVANEPGDGEFEGDVEVHVRLRDGTRVVLCLLPEEAERLGKALVEGGQHAGRVGVL